MQLTRSLPLIAVLLSLSGSAACVRPAGPAAGAALSKSLPAATQAIEDYLAWLKRTQAEVIASCAPTAAPKACARDKVAVLRASQLEPLRTIKAIAGPTRDAVEGLLGSAEGAAAAPPAVTLSIGTSRGALTAAPPEPPAPPPCTPITVNRELRPGETICPILGPAIKPVAPQPPAPPRALAPAPAGPAMSGPGPTLTPAPTAPGGGAQ